MKRILAAAVLALSFSACRDQAVPAKPVEQKSEARAADLLEKKDAGDVPVPEPAPASEPEKPAEPIGARKAEPIGADK